MKREEQQNELSRRLQHLVDQFISEYEVTVSEVIGILICFTLCLFQRAYNQHEKENGEPPQG